MPAGRELAGQKSKYVDVDKVTELSAVAEKGRIKSGEVYNISSDQVKAIFAEVESLSDKPTGPVPGMDRVFIPKWDNKPVETPPILSVGGTPILTHQNLMAIIATPGGGKSSNMEAILSSQINPAADNLSYTSSTQCRGAIWVDNERTNTDVWNSFHRLCRRAGISEGNTPENILIAGMRSIARLDARKKAIETLLLSNPCSLLLIDGAGDLVNDTNDLQEAIECRVWLREMTVQYDISIVVTLHPNPGTCKPRGHQGSEICREAESVLLLKPYEGDLRLITTDFEHGKNRNNMKITTAFTWSEDLKMFVTAEYDGFAASPGSAKKQRELNDLAAAVLPAPTSMRYVDLVASIKKIQNCSDKTAKRRITDMMAAEIIETGDDGYYRMRIKRTA